MIAARAAAQRGLALWSQLDHWFCSGAYRTAPHHASMPNAFARAARVYMRAQVRCRPARGAAAGRAAASVLRRSTSSTMRCVAQPRYACHEPRRSHAHTRVMFSDASAATGGADGAGALILQQVLLVNGVARVSRRLCGLMRARCAVRRSRACAQVLAEMKTREKATLEIGIFFCPPPLLKRVRQNIRPSPRP